jgi:hypothetical protein
MATASGFAMNDARLDFDEQAHAYRIGDRALPSVTQVLASAGIANFTNPWFTEAVRDRGTYVHAAIMLDHEGDLDETSLDPQLVPYLTGWRKFREDTRCHIEHWEKRVCDPDLGYAGTLDGIITRQVGQRERRELVDVKCGYYASCGPQTSAYRRCAFHLYDRPVVIHRAIVELPGDGSYRYHPLEDNVGDEQLFLAALRIFHWRAKHDAGR